MQVSGFPIMIAALEKAGNPRKAARLADAIALLNAGLEADQIANRDFIEAKGWVNSALETAWHALKNYDVISPYRRREAGNPMPSKTADFFDAFHYPSAHTAAGALKRLDKVPADAAVDLLRPLLVEIMPLAEAVQSLKDKTVKRAVKTDEERRAERFVAPPATTKAAKATMELLEELSQEACVKLTERLVARNLMYLDAFLAKQEAADSDATLMGVDRRGRPYSVYSIEHHFSDKYGTNWNGVWVLRDVCSYGRQNRVEFGADVREKLTQAARDQAEEIRAEFVVKNAKKIVSILDAKGDDKFEGAKRIGVEIDLSGLKGSIGFTFKDGSSFTVTNSVVFVINSYGTRFNRFPLTFHGVKLPGGKSMTQPSEKKMNEIFAKA